MNLTPRDFHLSSMTAFGRGEVSYREGRIVCELQSVNRRHLDLQVVMPRALAALETELRTYLTQQLGRGSVTCTVRWEGCSPAGLGVEPNLPLAKALQESWRQLAITLALPAQMPIEFLLAHQEHLFLSSTSTPLEEITVHVLSACRHAYEALEKIKQREGQQLAGDLVASVRELQQLVKRVEERAPEAVANYREKLLQRLQSILTGTAIEHDERVVKEIALFAERIDFSEEIVRLKSHLAQVEQWLCAPQVVGKQTKGKMGEFLIQELLREANTIGSKANDLAVTQSVVEMKHFIEQMREQIQNVE